MYGSSRRREANSLQRHRKGIELLVFAGPLRRLLPLVPISLLVIAPSRARCADKKSEDPIRTHEQEQRNEDRVTTDA